MDVVSSGLMGIAQCSLSAKARTFELDGQRTIDLSSNLALREDLLNASLRATGIFVPGLGYVGATLFWSKVAFSLSSIAQLVINSDGLIIPQTFDDDFQANHPRIFHSMKTVSSFLQECDKVYSPYIDTFLNEWAETVFNTISLVSYVALIALGQSITGSIGLISLALITIKREGYLPAFLERPLSYLEFGVECYTLVFIPRFFLLKALDVCLFALKIISYTANIHTFNTLLESFFGKFTNREHLIQEEKSLAAYLTRKGIAPGIDDKDSIEVFVKELDAIYFQVNYSSVHAFSWDEPLTQTQAIKLENITPVDQLNKLEFVCHELQISISPAADATGKLPKQEQAIITGWERLSGFIRNGVLPDQVPANVDEFYKLIKMIMFSIEETEDLGEKKQKIQDLLICCSGCVLAWTRDIEALVIPKSTDFVWRIHRELAKYRTELISDVFVAVNRVLPQLLESMGGVGNAHMHALMNTIVWHEWKSFRGELFMKTHGRDLVVRYLQSSPITDSSSPEDVNGLVGYMSRAFDQLHRCYVSNPSQEELQFAKQVISRAAITLYYRNELDDPVIAGMALTSFLMPHILAGKYYPTSIAEYIEMQIQMDQIPQPIITSWIAHMQGKGIPMLSDKSETGYDDRFVIQVPSPYLEDKTIFSLTRMGINLLLWDLGVIEPYLIESGDVLLMHFTKDRTCRNGDNESELFSSSEDLEDMEDT